MLKIVVNQTDDEAERGKQIKKMFINLQCPRCKIKVTSQEEVDRLRETCKQCRSGK